MSGIREMIRNVIEDRILPWIERDGISRLILPEQITPADCAEPIRHRRACHLKHRHHELGIGLTGRAPYCVDNKMFVFTGGRLLLVPAGTAHGPAQGKQWRTNFLDLDKPSSILWLAAYPFGIRVQVVRVLGDGDAEEASQPYMLLEQHTNRLMNCLLTEARSRPPNYARVGRCILTEIMERCLRATATATVDALDAVSAPPRRLSRTSSSRRRRGDSSKRGRSGRTTASKDEAGRLSSRVRAAMEFVHSNYHMPIGVDEIADAADTSASHLARQFKAVAGLTPMQYLMDVRMEAARQLLLTDLKVYEVARLVGIEDACYFSRAFGRNNGVSPLRYRRRMAKAVGPVPPMRDSKKVK